EHRIRRDRGEEPAADGVDGAGRPDGRVDPALHPADVLLVAPVETDSFSDRRRPGWTQQPFAADGTDAWIAEPRDQPPARASRERLPGVGEHHDVAARARDEIVQARRLAAPEREGDNGHVQ